MKITFNSLNANNKSLNISCTRNDKYNKLQRPDTLREKVKPDIFNETLRAYNTEIIHYCNTPENITSKKLFQLLNTQVMNLTENDIKSMFSKIQGILKSKGVNASDSEIKYTMKILTQFANLSAFKEIDKRLPKEAYDKYFSSDGCGLSEFMYILDARKHAFGDNEAIVDKNKSYVFADRFSLEQYNPISYKSIKYYKPYVVALTGFDEGINYFNHSKDYSQFIENTAKIIEEVKEEQKDSDFKTTLVNNLNERARKTAEEHGLKADIFLNIDDGNDADFNDILANLNFKLPTEKEIDALITSIAEFIEENTTFMGFKQNILKSALTKWYYNQLQIYSPKRINEEMKSLYKKIERSEHKGLNKEDLSLVIPACQKSYTYMTRSFAQANGINPKQVMTSSQHYDKVHLSNKIDSNIYPEKSGKDITIIIDDIAATGTSILSSSLSDIYSCENYKVYLAPLTCTARAINRINSTIKDKGFSADSKLIVGNIISEDTDFFYANYSKKEANMLEKLFDTFPHSIGRKGFSHSNTAVIFPVMTPDNNNTLVTLFSDKILLNPSASKSVYDRYARDVIEDKFTEKMNY